jgi:hypothetical protein
VSAHAPIILNFRRIEKNTLLAVFDIELASGTVICGAMLHESHAKHWIGLPSKGYVKQDGTQGWSKVVYFVDKQTHYRFQEIVTPLALAAYEQSQARGVA